MGRWRDEVNLALEKMERISTAGKGRGEIRSEIGNVIRMAADADTEDSLGKRYGTFGKWGMAVGEVEVLLVVGGAEAELINKYVNIKENNMEGEMVHSKSNRIVTSESLKEKEKGRRNQEGLVSSDFRKSFNIYIP